MTLCEIKRKDFHKEADKIRKMISDPQYVCQKCLRSASRKKFLCKPTTPEDL